LPPAPARGDRVLVLAGQGEVALGGRDDLGETDGYLDHVSIPPDGITGYAVIRREGDLFDEGFTSFASYFDRPEFSDAIVHLSVSWPGVAPSAERSNEEQSRVVDGGFDESIEELAAWCRATPHPILLRAGYEFERNYDVETYAQDFRYVVDRVRDGGADNVATVWASSNDPTIPLTEEWFSGYYPGDEHVDWFGASAFVPVLNPLLADEARMRNKPLFIAESTPITLNLGDQARYPLTIEEVEGTPLSTDELWDGWFGPFFRMIDENADIVAAIHYIAADWSGDPRWSQVDAFAHCDARLWVVPELLERWEQTISSAPFVPS
jgi:hypothetical protein